MLEKKEGKVRGTPRKDREILWKKNQSHKVNEFNFTTNYYSLPGDNHGLPGVEMQKKK